MTIYRALDSLSISIDELEIDETIRLSLRKTVSIDLPPLQMTPDERLRNILMCTTLGPVGLFWGMVDGFCECGNKEDFLWYFHKNSKTWKKRKHDPGKHPRPGFHNRATHDHETIREWFVKFPHANFAIKAGVKTATLDLDVREGSKNGVATLQQLGGPVTGVGFGGIWCNAPFPGFVCVAPVATEICKLHIRLVLSESESHSPPLISYKNQQPIGHWLILILNS
jgi:hypothetical protein